MSGGMVAMTLAHYTSWHPAWGPLTLVLTAGAIWLTTRGVRVSTSAVGAAVLVQVAIMIVVCVIVLVDQRARLSGVPFSWAHLTHGLAGLSAGFPLALYMFIGWENGPRSPKSAAIPANRPQSPLLLGSDRGRPVRLVRLRDRDRLQLQRLSHRAFLGPVPYRGGSLSRRSGRPGLGRRDRLRARHPGRRDESQARMLFDGGRTGLLPTGSVSRPRSSTPVNALLGMTAQGSGSSGPGG